MAELPKDDTLVGSAFFIEKPGYLKVGENTNEYFF
jgi:hypothetical protein